MFSGKENLEHCMGIVVAGHRVPCPISTRQLPEKNARTPLALGKISPVHHPGVPRLVTLGLQWQTSYGECVCVYSIAWNYLADYFFWIQKNPCKQTFLWHWTPLQTPCKEVSWLSLTTLSLPQCPLLFCMGTASESKSAFFRPFGILQTLPKRSLLLFFESDGSYSLSVPGTEANLHCGCCCHFFLGLFWVFWN